MTEKITSVSSMPKEAKKTTSRSEAEQAAVRELVKAARARGEDLTGPDGLLKSITATVLETALGEELTEHLGHEKHQAPTTENGNIRNGTRPKTVLTDAAGEVTIAVPRDRAGTFEPVIVKKRQRRLSDVDAVAISLFAKGLTNSATSIHSNSNIITKIYFPRIIAPVSAFANSFIDFVGSLIVLLLMIVGYLVLAPGLIGMVPDGASAEMVEAASHVRVFGPGPIVLVMIPLFSMIVILSGLGLGFWFSALQVRMRDINYIIPFVLQIGQYLTPIAYSSSIIARFSQHDGNLWQFLYGLNPLVTAIGGFRWAFYNLPFPDTPSVIASVLSCLVIFVTGIYFFRYSEAKFVDYL